MPHKAHPDRVFITFRPMKQQLAKLDEWCKNNNCSRNHAIEQAIELLLKKKSK